MKLKQLLEGYAWERTPGKPLPTLKDVAKAHATTNHVNEAAADESLARLAITLETAKENLDDWVRVNGKHAQLSPILDAISKLRDDLRN